MSLPVIDLNRVPEAQREEAKQILAELERLRRENPLEFFKAHSKGQTDFLASRTKITAAFAGNRFGKSTVLIVKVLCQLLSDHDVPEHLAHVKQVPAPAHGWLLCPTESKIDDSLKPAIQKWCPPRALKGGSWAKAYNGERALLTFANGSTLAFKTYRQDSSTLGGADLDFVGYDEPPPKGHRNECLARMARGVREWYAMTPIRVNVGWIRRDIYKQRESPDVTVVRGDIYDNPTLSKEAVEFILSQYPDVEREARAKGEFMDLAGIVYSRFNSAVLDTSPSREFVKGLDNIVGIDPGIRNAAFVFGGFDQHGVDWIWDELLIQDGTPTQYAEGIDKVLAKWGLRREDVMFVIDPAARQRSQATGDTVQSELSKVGIYTMNGNRDREAGQQQIRDRLAYSRIWVSPACVGLRDDAEEFHYPVTDEGDDDGSNGPADDSAFHRLATLRYQVMARPWYPQMEARAAERTLGWRPGQALPGHELVGAGEYAPMGPLS